MVDFGMDFLVRQSVSRYESTLDSWVRAIERATTLEEGVRLLRAIPNPGGPVSNIVISMARSAVSRAKHRADNVLEIMVRKNAPKMNTEELSSLQRLLAGHAPHAVQSTMTALRRLTAEKKRIEEESRILEEKSGALDYGASDT